MAPFTIGVPPISLVAATSRFLICGLSGVSSLNVVTCITGRMNSRMSMKKRSIRFDMGCGV